MKQSISRRSFLAGGAALAGFSLVHPVSAQGVPGPIGQTPVGSPVSIYNESGDETAKITVTAFTDPYLDWNEWGAPERGIRYVMATFQIEATGERPFEFSPWDFKLLDDIGILYRQGWVPRSDASTVAFPDLEEAIMLPGEIVTGSIAYSIPEVAIPMQLIYTGYGENEEFLYLLANVAPAS
jgi:hypothetical protein